jgi:hypothetical protein
MRYKVPKLKYVSIPMHDYDGTKELIYVSPLIILTQLRFYVIRSYIHDTYILNIRFYLLITNPLDKNIMSFTEYRQ